MVPGNFTLSPFPQQRGDFPRLVSENQQEQALDTESGGTHPGELLTPFDLGP